MVTLAARTVARVGGDYSSRVRDGSELLAPLRIRVGRIRPSTRQMSTLRTMVEDSDVAIDNEQEAPDDE